MQEIQDDAGTGASPKVAQIFGHSAFEIDFTTALQHGRLHHAWLLTGPRGIGKAQLALKAAAWLLSEEGGQALLDDVHSGIDVNENDPGAVLVLRGAHPDMMLVAPDLEDNKSGQIKINQIRALLPFMMHKPGRGGWRVAIIDSMDEVNRNVANALLKLLEEPPEKTILFLVSSRPGQLPPTIRSRCRVARLLPLGDEDSERVMQRIWPDADADQMAILTVLSEGAPGRATVLAESGAADCYQAACAIIAADRLDHPALAAICGKWGKGGAVGRASRHGAIMLIERMLRLSALRAAGGATPATCAFENRVIDVMCARYLGNTLAKMHSDFSREAARADGLYLDFAQFLMRQLAGFHRIS